MSVNARMSLGPAVSVVHADALDLSADLFAHFDALICDPPYGAHVHSNTSSMGSNGQGPHARDLGFASLSDRLRAQIIVCASSVRRWSAIFSDVESVAAWDEAARNAPRALEPVRAVPWIRWSQPQLTGDRPPSGCEIVNLYHPPGRKRWNGPGNLTHLVRRCMRGTDKHPTEKPLDLALDLVSWLSDAGESVIDLCAGVATTALACRLLGRACLAIEIDRTWAASGGMRVNAGLTVPRDIERAREWCATTTEQAERVPRPKAKDRSDVRTYERAQRRLDDVARVAEWLP
jgi:hypothetical protein